MLTVLYTHLLRKSSARLMLQNHYCATSCECCGPKHEAKMIVSVQAFLLTKYCRNLEKTYVQVFQIILVRQGSFLCMIRGKQEKSNLAQIGCSISDDFKKIRPRVKIFEPRVVSTFQA